MPLERKLLFSLGAWLLIIFISKGQTNNLCNLPEGAVAGNFEISVTNSCNPKKVEVLDLSGGDNIRYHFDYQGQAASDLDTTSPVTNIHNYGEGFDKPRVIAILQYGTKNGIPMYACKTHILRKSNNALFNATPCDNNNIRISIPKDGFINTFDFYEISFDNFNTKERVEANSLPFQRLYSKNLPTQVQIRGMFNDVTKNCDREVPPLSIEAFDMKPLDGFDRPFHPNIKTLTLTEETVQLSFTGVDEDSYSIYSRLIDEGYTDEPLLEGQSTGTIEIPTQETSQQVCFYVQNEVSACREERSAEVCSFPLTKVESNNNVQEIYFPPYPTLLNGKANDPFEGNELKINQGFLYTFVDDVIQDVISFNHQDGIVEYPLFDCSKEYCYQARLVLDGQSEGVKFRGTTTWSNKICFNPKEEEYEMASNVIVSLSPSNKPTILINPQPESTVPVREYFLWYEEDGVFNKIDSSTFMNPTFLTDYNGEERSHCFKVQARNQCGQVSNLSETVCSIFLEYENNNQLIWSPEKPFNTEILDYEVLKNDLSTGVINQAVQNIDKNTTSFSPNANLINEDVIFQIEARSDIGSSYSNTVKIEASEIPPNFYLPTAFTPNGDGHNSGLNLYGDKGRIKEFKLILFNSLGNTVFQTNEPNFEWTPRPNSIENGVYFYKMIVILTNNEILSRKGDITIIK